jgi:hypothetical protein
MKHIVALILGFVACGALAGETAAPALAPAAPPAATSATQQDPVPTRQALQQAVDGSMTCSALSAIIAGSVGADQAWLWKNRSFAFGMLAANFYFNATKEKLSDDELDNMLTQYANSLQGMAPKEREPFDTGCARRYTQMDKLCEQNHCPNAPPAASTSKPGAGALAQ